MSFDFEGKVALVTGSTKGLGRSTAQLFAKYGAKVVVTGRGRENGEETVQLIKDAGGEAIYVQTDVAKSEDVQAMVKAAVETYGGLDFAVNNAMIDIGGQFLADISEEDWDRGMGVNLTGVFLCMKYEIQAMLQRGGSIVNIGSGGGQMASPKISWYLGSKNAIYSITKCAALEYASRGIRINAVGPGVMWTPAMREAASKNSQHIDYLKSMSPEGRIAEPEEIAEAIVWISSPKASFVIGEVLVVDGGAGIHGGPLVGNWRS